MRDSGAVIVQTKVVGERSALDDVALAVPDGDHAWRDLLDVLVRSELERARADRHEAARRVLRVLTPADLARGTESGRYGSEGRDLPPLPDHASALERAVEAFGDGLYFVFVDEHQVESLDEVVTVRADTRLRLVRLVALAGG